MTNDTYPSPAKQRKDEWERIGDDNSLAYHTQQWDNVKQSTIAFERFCAAELASSQHVIDLGAGAGAATAFIAGKHPTVGFTAFDYSAELTRTGAEIAKSKGMANLSFQQGDWYELQATRQFDGVISLQTLSWLPNFEDPLDQVFRNLRPKWVAVSSLFYDGEISCQIEVNQHVRERKFFYNIYAIPVAQRFCAARGYELVKSTPFEIDIDIEKPADPNTMGTYTERVWNADNRGTQRLQRSGPLLMPWYMLLFRRHAND